MLLFLAWLAVMGILTLAFIAVLFSDSAGWGFLIGNILTVAGVVIVASIAFFMRSVHAVMKREGRSFVELSLHAISLIFWVCLVVFLFLSIMDGSHYFDLYLMLLVPAIIASSAGMVVGRYFNSQ